MATMTSPARTSVAMPDRDHLTVVAAMGVPVTSYHPLPTPPNSISPSLPPHMHKPYGTRAATAAAAAAASLEVDSDLDLHDERESDDDDASMAADATGTITTALLAKHHLPDILLAHGPLAIRHITGYLTTSVPGFSGIPPAKARRLVVGALEGRGVGEMEGMHGPVKFEKVGWGRWSAKVMRPVRGMSPPRGGPASRALSMPIAKTTDWPLDRTRLNAPTSSWAGNSATFSHDDDVDVQMMEDEIDRMSMDGSCSSSEAAPEDDIAMDDPADMTDDEDWAAVGAAALRAASGSVTLGLHPSAAAAAAAPSSHGGGGPSPSLMAKSMPLTRQISQLTQNRNDTRWTSNAQEREAIEALLQLGSI